MRPALIAGKEFTKGNAMRKTLLAAVVTVLAATGCQSGADKSLFDQIKLTGQEKTQLQLDFERLQKEDQQLSEQVRTLTALDKEVRMDAVSRVESIEISTRSGLFDKDGDGKKESLIVYVRTIDDAGDAVKAAGSAEVELWDLQTEKNARLAQWKIEPQELKKLWASTVMTSYFRLTFDTSELPADIENRELTVKVTFVDYLTGKVLREQMVIK